MYPTGYNHTMQIEMTETYRDWENNLRDLVVRARIQAVLRGWQWVTPDSIGC
jgi:putative component of toxin-antitoxin plasmid stabilization module